MTPRPPVNPEAEKGVIGSILISPAESLPLVGRLIQETDFHLPAHQVIYTTCCELWERSQALDLILLTQALRKAKKLEEVGGPGYLSELYMFTPTAANVAYYAEGVRETAHLRFIWQTCGQISNLATEKGADATGLSAQLGTLLARLSAGMGTEAKTMETHVGEALERYEQAVTNKGPQPGVMATGLKDLDKELNGGFHPGNFVVLSAETSGGKTAASIQFANHNAVNHAAQVMIVSYEMAAWELVDRLIALNSGVASFKLRSGLLSERDFMSLTNNVGKLAASGIHLRDDIGHWTADDIAREARGLKATKGLDMVIVDYLQLAAPRVQKNRIVNREREVADMSRSFKNLAKELKIPVIALSQLTDGKLRESRAIGHDADTVLSIGDCYDKDDKKRLNPIEGQKTIYIEKQRNGARDIPVNVGWSGPLMRLSDL